MAILELTLVKPEPVGASMRSAQLRALAETAFVREVPPGTRRECITDERWNNQSHSWWLTVRRDGIGVLEIKPEWRHASIQVADGKRPQRLREVTYTLNRPQVQLLAGTQVLGEQDDRVSMLFKMICYTDGKTLPF